MERRRRGWIYLYTGDGGGKTTAALGLALRSLGQGSKVVIVQFMKGWRNTGEYRIRRRLAPDYEIHLFGRRGWVNLRRPSQRDVNLAERGLAFAREALKKRPHLLVLDEVNLAAAIGLVKAEHVAALLREVPSRTNVVLTGRYAPSELVNEADFVNVVSDAKHPPKIPTTRGIQY